MLDTSVSRQMKEEPRWIEAMAEENCVLLLGDLLVHVCATFLLIVKQYWTHREPLGRLSSDSNAKWTEYMREWCGTRVFHWTSCFQTGTNRSNLTGAFCPKLSCLIIYSHNLSLGFGPLGGGGGTQSVPSCTSGHMHGTAEFTEALHLSRETMKAFCWRF